MAENQPDPPYQVLLGEGAVQDLTRMREAAAADGRDIVVSKVGDGTGKPNHRLTFREIPGRNAGGTDARDVIQ